MRNIFIATSRIPGWVELEFQYDKEIINAVKRLRHRSWDPELRRWLEPVDLMDHLAAELERIGVRMRTVSSPVFTPVGTTLSPDRSTDDGGIAESARGQTIESLVRRAEEELLLRNYSPRTQ